MLTYVVPYNVIQKPNCTFTLGLVIYLSYGVKNSKLNPLNTRTADMELTGDESPLQVAT